MPVRCKRSRVKTILKYAGRGPAVVASFLMAATLLFAGPARIADALVLTNNINTPISVSTNVATGTNTSTTLAPIIVTCGVIDITAGAATGVTGVRLNLSAGWTFTGGAAPTISYAWGGGPTGDAVGTIASASSITMGILADCDPGDVITITGVQVKPLTGASGNGTITADIARTWLQRR